MPERLLVDTDIVIDYLRGVPEAVAFLENATEELLISAITVAELYAGVREGEGKERRALESFLAAFEIVPLDQAVAERGGLFRCDFGKSHNTGLADALVAAIAAAEQARVVTLNAKHFPMFPDALIPYRKHA